MNEFHGYIPIAQEFLRIEAQVKALEDFEMKNVPAFQMHALATKYLNVLICRAIEGSIKHIIYTQAVMNGKTSEELDNVEKELEHFRTPKWKNIKDTFLKILNIKLEEDELFHEKKEIFIEAIKQIVDDRHLMAHSTINLESMPITKTLPQIKMYFENIKDCLDSLCFYFSTPKQPTKPKENLESSRDMTIILKDNTRIGDFFIWFD